MIYLGGMWVHVRVFFRHLSMSGWARAEAIRRREAEKLMNGKSEMTTENAIS